MPRVFNPALVNASCIASYIGRQPAKAFSELLGCLRSHVTCPMAASAPSGTRRELLWPCAQVRPEKRRKTIPRSSRRQSPRSETGQIDPVPSRAKLKLSRKPSGVIRSWRKDSMPAWHAQLVSAGVERPGCAAAVRRTHQPLVRTSPSFGQHRWSPAETRLSRSVKRIRARVAVKCPVKCGSKSPGRPEVTLRRSTSSHTSSPHLLGYAYSTRLLDPILSVRT